MEENWLEASDTDSSGKKKKKKKTFKVTNKPVF
jgi:hypothetical protein